VIAIICTITTASKCVDETNNTLKFASRAKKITLTTAVINETMDDKALIRHYEAEVLSLKSMVADLEGRLQAAPPASVSSADTSAPAVVNTSGIGPYVRSTILKVFTSCTIFKCVSFS
jgi:hypothetical protein